MKKSVQYGILLVEAILCVVLALLPALSFKTFSGIMAFPFEQISWGLQRLSLASAFGNIVAIVIYVVFCLSPVAFIFFRKYRKLFPEDYLLFLLSLMMFWVIYLMINPGEISILNPLIEENLVVNSVLGGTLYSMIVGYFIFRILRLFYCSSNQRVLSYLYAMLFLLNIIFIMAICYIGVRDVVGTIKAFHINNSGNQHLFGINTFFEVLRFLVENLAYAFDIAIVFSAMSFIKNMKMDRFSEDTVRSTQELAKICGVSLIVVIGSNIGLNILQLLLGNQLFLVNSSIQIPLFSVVFVLICLLLTRLVKENKTLKEENDSII